MKRVSIVSLLIIVGMFVINAQSVRIEGYAYETDNRGYLNEVQVRVLDEAKSTILADVYTNLEGYFEAIVPAGQRYTLIAEKDLFFQNETIADATNKGDGDKIFVKFEMKREPGYLFDVTIAPERANDDIEVDGILGAKIEIYNNTVEKEELVIESHPSMNFQFTFKQGNHYTLLIRKEGYFTKRMEAYVNVDGCILCFEGVGEVRPGVTDNLTAGHEMGTLLANVELKPIRINEGIELQNIYYDYNKSRIRPDAAVELDKLIGILRDNPHLIVELGSHTDSRGKANYNMGLSQRRAEAAVDYLITQGNINDNRIKAKGYGMTELVNKCKPGVECTDEEHQENRRTELKVVGFLDVDPLKDKSLADIKDEERIEALLREVQQGEVIEIPAGGEMPDDLKEQLENEKAIEMDSIGTHTSDQEFIETDTKLEDVEVLKSELKSEMNTNEEEVQSQTDSQKVDAEESLDEIFEKMNNVGSDEVESEEETSSWIREIDEETTGYFIQLFHASSILDSDHPYWNRLKSGYQEARAAGGFSYLTGVYNSRAEAMDTLDRDWLSDFPDAFVVQFMNGKRIK